MRRPCTLRPSRSCRRSPGRGRTWRGRSRPAAPRRAPASGRSGRPTVSVLVAAFRRSARPTVPGPPPRRRGAAASCWPCLCYGAAIASIETLRCYSLFVEPISGLPALGSSWCPSWAGFARGADLTASAMAARFLAAECCVRGLSVALSLGSGVLYASACLLVPYMPLGWSGAAVARVLQRRKASPGRYACTVLNLTLSTARAQL